MSSIAVFPNANCSDYRVALILNYICSEEPSRLPSLKFFSLALDASESYLRHKFKEVTGLSYGAYIRHLRFVHARKLLEAGGATVKRARLEIGLHDHSSFSKAYKRYFGETPKRTKARGDHLKWQVTLCSISAADSKQRRHA